MRQRRAWWAFAAGCAAIGGALVFVSGLVLQLERDRAAARRHGDHEAVQRLALWRMDSWLAPLLAREAARPVQHWRSFVPQRQAYTNVRHQLAPDEVVAPSPLLVFRSALLPLHFEVDADGGVTSPQVPADDWRRLAEETVPGLRDIDDRARQLAHLRAVIDRQSLASACAEVAALLATTNTLPVGSSAPGYDLDFQNRALVSNMAQQHAMAPAPAWTAGSPGPLVAVWLPESPPQLAFVREVRSDGGDLTHQGVLADWPRLRADLLAQVSDLDPTRGATLEPLPGFGDRAPGESLAMLPAKLHLPPPSPVASGWGAAHTALAGAWLATLLAALAVGYTLHSTLALGERRARFASTVTHELRTPLTTFRMYSEMLADGMVRDAAQRQQYLETLRHEADRLTRLVENVLCYARVEDGRFRVRRTALTLTALAERTLPELRRRVQEAGFSLRIAVDGGDTPLATDPDAVAQVLFNLIDNACKYGASAQHPDITLSFAGRSDGGGVEITVTDEGPGIPSQRAPRVFAPFERFDDEAPGIGLGLSLSRALARDLGGDLQLKPSARGACFALRLPA